MRRIRESFDKDRIKRIVAEYFEYDINFKFQDIVVEIVDNILYDYVPGDEIDDGIIFEEIDRGLIDYAPRWTIAMFYYASPEELDWGSVLEQFTNDISSIVNKAIKLIKRENEDN